MNARDLLSILAAVLIGLPIAIGSASLLRACGFTDSRACMTGCVGGILIAMVYLRYDARKVAAEKRKALKDEQPS